MNIRENVVRCLTDSVNKPCLFTGDINFVVFICRKKRLNLTKFGIILMFDSTLMKLL